MNKQGLKQGILIIFLTNVFNMGFKIIINLIQPKLLSVQTYAVIQTYALYISYAGLLHLGFVDGMYLNYGGKVLNNDTKKQVNKQASSLRGLQFVITVVAIIVSLIIKDKVLLYVSISILPANIASLFRMVYQATGEYKKYGLIMNINTILSFVTTCILLFIMKTDNASYYLIANVLVYIIVWLILEKWYFQKGVKIFAWDKKDLITNIKEGLPLTLGNLSSSLYASLDRWFVKFLLTINDFAYYSFAVSMQTFMNIAVSPITITLYNYLCTQRNRNQIDTLRHYVIIFSTLIVSVAFPAKFIVELFIKKYVLSLNVLFLLFATSIFNIIIQGYFVNLYKAQKRQKTYFNKLIISLIIGFALNCICYLISHTNEAFAVGTVIAMFIWLMMCQFDFKDIKLTTKELMYVLMSALLLIVFGKLNSIIGFVIYITYNVIVGSIFFKSEYFSALKMFGRRIIRKK